MSFVKCKRAEVDTNLFIGGTNLGLKLDPSRRVGLILEYDEKTRLLKTTWNNETGYTPAEHVVVYILGEVSPAEPQVSHPTKAGMGHAQVETPYGHVFAGPGGAPTPTVRKVVI